MKLEGGNAVLVRAHHVESHEPLRERNLRPLEDGSDEHRELLAALGALPDATVGDLARLGQTLAVLRLDEVRPVDRTTVRALGTVRPTHFFKKLIGRCLIGELLSDDRDVQLLHAQLWGEGETVYCDKRVRQVTNHPYRVISSRPYPRRALRRQKGPV